MQTTLFSGRKDRDIIFIFLLKCFKVQFCSNERFLSLIKKGKKKVDKSTESTNVQVVKKKRGPKRSAEITRITNQRRVIGKAYLELYVNNCLDVKWGNGLMAFGQVPTIWERLRQEER